MKSTVPSEAARIQRAAMLKHFTFKVDLENNTVEVINPAFEIIVFDTETSGLDDKVDKVVQLSAIKFRCENGVLEEIDRFDTFINQPEYDENKVIPDEEFVKENGREKTFKDLTGITNELLSKYPTEAELFPTILEFFGDNPIVCGHNVPFDYKFLTQMYIRNGANFLPVEEDRIDTLVLARDLIPKSDAPKTMGKNGKERATYTLGALAGLYGIDQAEDDSSESIVFHNSMNDVIVTSRLLKTLIYEFAQRELNNANENIAAASITKERAMVKSITYWAGYRGFSRLYVNAVLRGSTVAYYYDVRKREWGEREEGTIVATQMDELIADALELAGVTSENDFGKLTDKDLGPQGKKADEAFLERYK